MVMENRLLTVNRFLINSQKKKSTKEKQKMLSRIIRQKKVVKKHL
jgi:hypothetical protein